MRSYIYKEILQQEKRRVLQRRTKYDSVHVNVNCDFETFGKLLKSRFVLERLRLKLCCGCSIFRNCVCKGLNSQTHTNM